MLSAGIDTEATGVHTEHGARPFIVSGYQFDDETGWLADAPDIWEWDVDPMTRRVLMPKNEAVQVRDYVLSFEKPVFHNKAFDVRMLRYVHEEIACPELFARSEDTLPLSHLYDSYDKHDLKSLAIDCGIPNDDQKLLKDVINACRDLVMPLGWAVASKTTTPLKRAPKSGWWVMDMWLAAAVLKHLPTSQVEEYMLRKGLTLSDVAEAPTRYAGEDAVRTVIVWKSLYDTLGQSDLWHHYEWRNAIIEVAYEMEGRGIPLRNDRVEVLAERFEKARTKYLTRSREIIGNPKFNHRSSPQKCKILYEKYGVEVVETSKKTGKPAAGKDTFHRVLKTNDPTSELWQWALSTYAATKADKLLGMLETYKRLAVPLVQTHNGVGVVRKNYSRLHGRFNPFGTHSLRGSSNDPNLQNISKGKDPFIWKMLEEAGLTSLYDDLHPAMWNLRECFGPEPGREWLCIDGKQLQLVIFAYASGEINLQEQFAKGYDAHDIMARIIFGLGPDEKPTDGQRTIAKNVNFGFIFGAQAEKIEATAKMPGLWDILVERFPNATDFIAEQRQQVYDVGYVLTTGGYPLVVPKKQAYAGVNYIAQGTEGEIIQKSMLACREYLRKFCRSAFITMNVHDELVFDFPAGQARYFWKPLCNVMRKVSASIGVGADFEAKLIAPGTGWEAGVKLVSTVA